MGGHPRVEGALLLAAVTLGVFVGCQLTEGLVLVPYWRELSPHEFLAWYAANDRRLLGFFGAVTVTTLLVVLVRSAAALWTAVPGRWAALLATVLYLAVLAVVPLYFGRG